MASSTMWTAVGGAAVVAGAIAGAVLWRHTHHPDAPLPLAVLPPAVKQMVVPGLTPVAPPAPTTQTADRGPEPPSAPAPQVAPLEAPSFDVVRVEKSGDTVIAGKGEPGADVALMASGKQVAEAKADENGQFVMTPPPMKPGSYDLSLEQRVAGKPPQTSKQSVAVAVPESGKGAPFAALSEPGQPTKVLSSPAQAAKPGAEIALAIRSAELENGSGFFATGTAPAGAKIRLYLNDSHVADVTAAANGQWTLRVRNGLTGGHYKVRADSVGPDGQKVIARVEVSFDVPMAMAKAETSKAETSKVEPAKTDPAKADPAKPDPAKTASKVETPMSAAPVTSADAPPPPSAPNPTEVASAAPEAKPESPPRAVAPVEAPSPSPKSEPASVASPSDAVIASVETALVVPGDNLWDISRVRLGDPLRYTRIYTANAGQIRNPNLIYPGQVFVVPSK